jgi:hypothetical protein
LLAIRAWLRYLVPLTLIAVVACAPLLYIAATAKGAATLAAGRTQIRTVWVLAGAALVFHLLLVAGVAPAVRALATGEPVSQLRALGAGLANLGRGVLPWLVVVAAIVLGSVALVVPGVLLACLLAVTGASDSLRTSPQAAIADSIATARSVMPHVVFVVVAIVIVDLAIAFAAQTLIIPTLTKKMAATKLLPVRSFVRVTLVAIVAIAPLGACGLAAVYARSHAKRR